MIRFGKRQALRRPGATDSRRTGSATAAALRKQAAMVVPIAAARRLNIEEEFDCNVGHCLLSLGQCERCARTGADLLATK